MFDFSFTEMLLSGVVALVVLGPERLPKVARKAGEWVGKIQRLAAGVKQELAANGEYAELSKVKQDFTSTVADLKQELQDFGKQVEQETQEIAQQTQELAQQTQEIAQQTQELAQQVQEDTRPAWERLPEQKTPADFGIEETSAPAFDYARQTYPIATLNAKSLRKQAMARKRDARPRHRATPKLRSRR